MIGRGRAKLLRIIFGSSRGTKALCFAPEPQVFLPRLAPSLRLSAQRWTSRPASLDMNPATAAGEPSRPRETRGARKPVDYAGLPKVELHVHMDGACRVDTLQELSRKHGLDYPHDDPEEFKKCIMLHSPATSLVQFLKVFEALTNILHTKEALERVAYEYCEDLKNQNVVYFEMRYSPLCQKVDPEQYIEAVMAGVERGERDFGVKVRHILCFLRGSSDETGEEAAMLLELALKYRSRGVVGMDIAGDELLPLHPRQREALLAARANGLHLTMHAGESGPPENVRQAIEEFGAERIGHGYRVVEDEAIYQLARERKVHFEACLVSSIFTNSQKEFESHVVKRWALDGTSFSLSTDDPGITGSDLLTEYKTASERVGLTKEQLVKSVLDGVAAAFLPDDEKEQLLGRVRAGITEWENSL